MSDIAIKIENVSKEYRLGAIGGTTLREEMHRFADKLFHRTPANADYGKKFMALQDINLEVKKGERLGIIGHNGAGKSTLLKLLARVTAPTTGTISYNGRISSMLEVGTGFHGELTGRENIYMNGAILGMRKWEIDKKIDSIINFAEMQQFIDTPVKRYSSGMYVKLAFAVAAHLDNEILIMDEVLAVGDMNFQRKCIDKMNEVSREAGRTILYVSHNMNTIRQLCSRCFVLQKGKIVYDGESEKAIEIYLNKNQLENSGTIDLTTATRAMIKCTKEIQILSLKFINKEITTYYDDESLIVNIKTRSFKDMYNVVGRLTIRWKEDVPIGSLWSSAIDSLPKGEHTLQLRFPLELLPRGTFGVSIGIWQKQENGSYGPAIDHITNAFRLDIIQRSVRCGHQWHEEWLGPVNFPGGTLKEIMK